MNEQAQKVVEFWQKIGPEGWFSKNDEVDREIVDGFSELHKRAAARELDGWKEDPESCLALILVLDQFSRNMFRDDARAFATDGYAVELAEYAIDKGYPAKVPGNLATFLYMPFMHSERIGDQQRCVLLMHAAGAGENVKYAIIHRDIIARFGRFPHRNKVLGRNTTPAEQAFLDGGGFSG